MLYIYSLIGDVMKNIRLVLRKGCILLPLFWLLLAGKLDAQTPHDNPCLPAYTQTERDRIVNPSEGTLIENTSTGCIERFESGQWKAYCQEENSPLKQMANLRYDSLTNSFKVYHQGKWLPLEQYTLMMQKPQEKPTAIGAAPKEPTTPEWNGEIMPEQATKPERTIDDCLDPPTMAYAGQDAADVQEVKLQANKPLHGIGSWHVLKGDSGIFSNPTHHQTSFSGIQGVTYTLQWQIATRCDTSVDEVFAQIRFPCEPEPSQAHAGSDQHNVEVAQLHAATPKSGEGHWTIIGGIGGKLEDPTKSNSRFMGEAGETYTLRWIVRTKCGYTQDDVNITFKPPCKPKPSQAYAGEDQLDVKTCRLGASQPTHGKGRWQIVSGKDGRLESPDLATSSFHGKAEETYVLKWTVSNACGKTEDEVTIRFRKTCPAVLTDKRDGNTYAVLLVGKACWMAKNLNYQQAEHYCYDDYDENCKDYGALYTWEQAMDYSKKEKSRGVCPEGWHLPSDDEWESLMSSKDPNGKPIVTNDTSAFNMEFGGTRYPNGRFFNKREYAFYWSSTSKASNTAWNRYVHNESRETEHYATQIDNAFSVRCVQD
jgi:uncharacterized protein (TIGR02145 family)